MRNLRKIVIFTLFMFCQGTPVYSKDTPEVPFKPNEIIKVLKRYCIANLNDFSQVVTKNPDLSLLKKESAKNKTIYAGNQNGKSFMIAIEKSDSKQECAIRGVTNQMGNLDIDISIELDAQKADEKEFNRPDASLYTMHKAGLKNTIILSKLKDGTVFIISVINNPNK